VGHPAGSSLPRVCITVILTRTVHHQFAWELVTAWHGTARGGEGGRRGGGGMEGSVGFKYGKMKGLKISPVLRGGTDRSYIIPLRETRLPYPSAAYPTLLRVPPPRPSSSRLRRPFALASISPGLRFAQHAILQATHPPRGGSYVRATPVGLRGCLEMWRLRDSRENSVKRL